MATPLRVLIVEDNLDDAELMVLRLEEEGFQFTWRRVDNESDYVAALETPLDLILADWSLPHFSGRRALQLMKQRGLDIPFIIFSGSIGEEAAVEVMRQGAYDYVLKDRPARLGQAVRHALEDKLLREEQKRAEAALRESQARYRALVEQIPTVVYLDAVDETSSTIYISPQVEAMSGYSPEEWVADPGLWPRLLHPDDRERVLAEHVRTNTTGETFKLEYRLVARDGRVVWIRDEAIMMRDSAGCPLYWQGIMLDVTERKQAEEALAKEHALFRTLIDNLPDTIYFKDTESRFTRINQALACRFGLSDPAQAVGKTDFDFFTEEHARPAYEDEQAILRSGQPLVGKEEKETWPDGHVGWVSTTKMPLRDHEGRIIGTFGISRDITERKQAEEALRESEEQYRALFEAARDGIALADTDTGILLDCNQALADLTGRHRTELIGQHQAILHPPSSNNTGFSPTFKQHMTDQEGQVLETQVLTATGEIREVEIKASLLYLQGRKMLQGIFHDVTERKRAEEALAAERTLLRTLIDNLPDRIYAKDTQARFTLNNAAHLRALGVRTQAEALGKTDFDFRPRDMAERYAADDRAVLQSGQPLLNWEEPTLLPTGEPGWLLVSKVPLRDPQGKVIGLVGISRDITERKRAEEALRESEARFRTLSEATFEGIVVLERDMIVDANPTFAAMFGYELSEIIGRSALELAAPESRALVRQNILSGSEQPYEAVGLRKDGTHFIGELRGRAISYRGRPARITAIRDITERKQAEEEIRRRAAEIATLYQASQQIAQAVLDREQLYVAIHQAVERLMPAEAFVIVLWNDALQAGEAVYLIDQGGRWPGQPVPPGRGLTARVISTGQPVQIDDFVPETIPDAVHFGDSKHVRSILAVPLRLGEHILGMISTQSYQPCAYTAHAQTLLEMLAAHAATAIENARLFEETRRRVTELTVLYESSLAFARLLDPASSAQHIVNTLAQHMNWHHAAIRQKRPGSDELELLAFSQPGLQPQDQEAVRQHMQRLVGRMGEGMSGWVAQTGQPVRAGDVTQYPQYVETFPGIRSGLYAPMKVGDEVVGVIALESETADAFSEHDERLLTTLAAQAAVALENARLLQAERAARQRLETLYHIGQALSSTQDFAVILDRLTDEAMRATNATHGSALVARLDLGCFERRSLRGYSPEQAERARSLPLPLNQGINGRAYNTRQAICVGDVQTAPDYFPLIPQTRSELAVPILHSDQVLGTLDLQSPEVDVFRDVDLEFLKALTDQVAIALVNARLFAETRRRLDEMAVVSQVALVGAAGRPFDETVARATQTLGELWPNVRNYGFLFLDEASQWLHPHASYFGVPPEVIADLHIPSGQGLIGWVARERQPVRVADVARDPRYIMKTPGTISEMAAPLIAGDRVLGVINVESALPDAFSSDDLRLLTTLAGQLATVLEKARLDAELAQYTTTLEQRVEERTAELRAVNEQLRQAHEEVRRALDKERELGELKSRFISMASHEFRTPLTSILSSAEMLEHYSHKLTEQKRLEHLHRIQASVKNMIGLLEDVLIIGKAEAGKLEFAPAPMDMVEFCRDLVEEMQLSFSEHTLRFRSQGQCEQAWLDERLLRHILLNLISNACKYSPAGSAVDFDLTCQADRAILRIQDYGIGIPIEDQARLFETFHRARNVGNTPGTGLGMAIVKRSVDLHGGAIQVDSQVGVGTTVTVTLPLERVLPSPLPQEDDHEPNPRD